MSETPLLEIENLATRFHTDDGTVNAVNGVTYTLHEGETLGVVGESGCGKSVHVLSIMRLIPIPPGEIASGIIDFKGRDLLKLSDTEMRHVRGREISMIFQDPMTSLNPVISIGNQITESLKLHMDMNDKQANVRAAELLDLVGIPEAHKRLTSFPHEFSGGMRQRAMIAMALSCEPQILIADEPTTALDVTIQAQIIELVKRLREQIDMSIIWITHDLGVVAGIADVVQVMYAGYIVEKADVKSLYGDPRHPYTIGLLNSRPRVDRRQAEQQLIPITGTPPNLISMPSRCPFAPRCRFAVDRCWVENPPLVETEPGRQVACWVDVREAEQHEVSG